MHTRKPRGHDAGQALVESALVLPLLLTVALGMLQVVLYVHAHDVLTSAAQEGARLAAEDGRGLDEGFVRARALVAAGLGSTVDPVRVGGGGDDELVAVRVDASLRPILPLPLVHDLPVSAVGRAARERFRPQRQPVTARVFDCTTRPPQFSAGQGRGGRPRSRPRGFTAAVLTALVLVPLAGAAESPRGFGYAAVSAVIVLLALRLFGARTPWGWLGLLLAAAAAVLPPAQLAPVGPGLFVGACLCLELWLLNRGSGRWRDRGRPPQGSRERDAQLVMGLTGERHVGQVLARELPADFIVVNGLKLPRGAGDIDHLVVGPTGVFLLETKTMAGRIVCEPNGTWRRTKIGRAGTPYEAFIGDPAAQVQRNIFAVRECLRRAIPTLFRGTSLWIEGMVVFPHPRAELDTDHSRVPTVLLDQAAPRICLHAAPRALQPNEIERVVDALLVEANERRPSVVRTAQSAQALVETALALPLVLSLLFGTLALSRVIQAQTAVVAVAREAARAGALASSADDAVNRMRQRVDLVAPGFGLDPRALVLDWDVSTFGRDRGSVVATVRYTVSLSDLPLPGWVPATAVRAEHVEWVDPFRSGLNTAERSAP